jgi:hypothetical protein
MASLLKMLIAVALFIGAGYVTRPLFQQWLDSKLKEGEEANKKNTADWQPVQGTTYWQPAQGTTNWRPVQGTTNWRPAQGDFQENKMDRPKSPVLRYNPTINTPRIDVPQPPASRSRR